MCLPFCGGHNDHESPTHPGVHSKQEDGQPDKFLSSSSPVKEPNHGYHTPGVATSGGEGKNGGAAAQECAAASYNSDSDLPASVGVVRGRKGAAEKIAAPTTVPQAPEHTEHGAARPRRHGRPDTALQQPEVDVTDKMKAAPVPQVARRSEEEEDYPAATAATAAAAPAVAKGTTAKVKAAPVPQVARRSDDDYPASAAAAAVASNVHGGRDHDDDHGGEDDRKLRGKSW